MKKGITLISIIIYLVLFTTFTAFAVSLTSNMNRNVLMDKGNSIIETEYSKIYTNLLSSAKNSSYFNVSKGEIKFSNGDIYIFDVSNSILYKNGGILCNSLNSFNLKNLENLSSITIEEDILRKSESLYIEVGLKKYDSSLKRDIIVSLGDDIK